VRITKKIAQKVLEVVDAGLVSGVGVPEPGKLCVEAAVCLAMGLPHGDEPTCVAPALRALKIRLNDSNWSSEKARAKGLRRLAVIQLGSKDNLDEVEFAKRCATLAIRTCVPNALRAAASLLKKGSASQERLLAAADLCEREPTRANAIEARSAAAAAAYAAAAAAAAAAAYAADAAYAAAAYADAAAAAYAAANAAYAAAAAADAADAAARDSALSDYCEGVVQILLKMKVPGAKWLALTEAA
jgi:nucleoid-associated protein YgaU